MVNLNKNKFYLGFIPLLITYLYFAFYLRNHSTFFMPREYKVIKRLVNNIASKNNLGDREIPFYIGSGTYMEVRAKELGLCKEDNCWYFNNLSPYKNHKNINGIDINTLVKNSNLFNGIEGYAWRGIVWLSQSTFRTYGEKKDYLNCTIGHELSHIIFNNHIDNAIKIKDKFKEIEKINNEDLKKIEEKKELFELELNRESEMKADANAAKMLINIGYPKETCVNELKFLAVSSRGDAYTDKNSTHPGFVERIDSLKKFVDKYDKEKDIKEFKPYNWKWTYNRKLNTLIFKPNK
tara:strand:+ start:94 stop:975 length:882 start_codon:yes stop_codon:yes gene_type:complete